MKENNIVKRIKADTPLFFKKVRNISTIIAGACGALLISWGTLPAEFTANVPQWIISCITALTLGSAVTSQLTKIDKDFDSNKEENKD